MTKNQKAAIKTRSKIAKLGRRTKLTKARQAYRQAKHQANLNDPGIKGYIARRVEQVRAKTESNIQRLKNEPKLEAKERIARLKAETDVKKTKAKGRAIATVASALGSSYGVAKIKESDAQRAKYEAEKAVYDAYSKIPVKDVETETTGDKSVAGLVTGVR